MLGKWHFEVQVFKKTLILRPISAVLIGFSVIKVASSTCLVTTLLGTAHSLFNEYLLYLTKQPASTLCLSQNLYYLNKYFYYFIEMIYFRAPWTNLCRLFFEKNWTSWRRLPKMKAALSHVFALLCRSRLRRRQSCAKKNEGGRCSRERGFVFAFSFTFAITYLYLWIWIW